MLLPGATPLSVGVCSLLQVGIFSFGGGIIFSPLGAIAVLAFLYRENEPSGRRHHRSS